MTKIHKLYGSIVALITPFRKDHSIDLDTFEKLIKLHIEAKTQAIVIGGTTGEGASLTKSEIETITKTAQQIINLSSTHQPLIILGMAENCTFKAYERFEEIAKLNPDAIMVLSPYYNKPTQEGIFKHYAELDQLDIPIIIYNCPGRTGSNIEAETTLRMANELKNIIAIKEASGNLDQIKEILTKKPKDFIVFSGDDAISYDLLEFGIQGTISVVANEYPAEFQKMFELFKADKRDEAHRIHLNLLELMNANFIESNPIPVKSYMQIQGLIPEDHYRLPMLNATVDTHIKLEEIYNSLKNV
jgi:4-hydroxy-tetrahydrodipicolinate synthase